MEKKTFVFLNVLKYTNYVLLGLYISLLIGFGWFEEHKQKKYRRILNTIFTMGIGLLLISLKYPIFIDVKDHIDEVTSLMVSAGIIVLSTLRIDDVKTLIEFIKSFFLKDNSRTKW